MKLVVGLGNPGEKYQNTRHNLGFLALDALLEKFEPVEKTFWEEKKDLKSTIKLLSTKSQPPKADSQVILAKPLTFMNNSGFAISRILNYYKIPAEEMVVIHDDLDMPFGRIKVRFGGSAGGHRGVESVINTLGNDRFLRIRLGIGDPRRIPNKQIKSKNYRNVEEYVLANITSAERGKVKTMLKETVRIIELILKHGIDKYMAKYNK